MEIGKRHEDQKIIFFVIAWLMHMMFYRDT